MHSPFRPLALALLSISLLLSSGRAVQTDTHGIHAVPVPGKVTIDGKLDDWDLSGEVLMCYDVETLKDVYSARVAAMYDADNLYVSIHWTDPNPMSNSHDPHYQADRAWAGDSVQLRIKTDKISHVTAYYYAAHQEPALFIDYGKDLTHPFGGGHKTFFQSSGWKLSDGAEMGFVKDADGKGYVQEIKIPWALVTDQKKYAAGDAFHMGVELLWGPVDWPVHRYADNMNEGFGSREFFFTNIPAWGPVVLEPKGSLKLPKPSWQVDLERLEPQGPVEIAYDLPEDARVSLAVDDPAGKRVRNLVPALPRQKGRNVEHWDGLDDAGKPVPPGDYRFKALYHHGIHTTYLFSFANPGNPTWDTADGRGSFYADHSAAHAVTAAGDVVALGCPVGEAGRPIIALDLAGQRIWGGGRPLTSAGRMSLATDGKLLWIALDKTGSIYRVDAATGKFAPWNRISKDPEGHDFHVLDLPVFDGSTLPKDASYVPNMRSICVHGGILAVPLRRDGVIRLLDAETGDTKGEIKVDAPEAAAFDADGSLIVLAGGRLVRATADGKTAPFADGPFPDGYGLAVDSKRNVYLSVRGADQDVKVFSPAGKPVREIGRKGGRPLVGAYDAAGMRNPAAIAVDSKDRLWVTEETANPKRTSLWDAATGALVRDFAGSTTYSGAGAIDPFDPTIGFSDNTVYKLDWTGETYVPVQSLGLPSGPDDLFPPRVHSITSRVVRSGKREYAYSTGNGASIYVTLHDGDTWRSAAALGVVPKKGSRGGEWAAGPLFDGHEGQLFAWADKNGDGQVQAEELSFASPASQGKPLIVNSSYWGQLPDAAGTVAYSAKTGPNDLPSLLVKLPIAGQTPCGAPIFDVANPQVIPLENPLHPGEGMTFGGAEGRTYFNQNPLTAVDKDGKTLFTYPNPYLSVHGSHDAPSARPGMLIGPSSFLGVADMGGETGEVFYLNGNLGENFLFTWDGLYIQSLFKDCRVPSDIPQKAVKHVSWDAVSAGGESFGGNFVRTPDGKTYLVNGGTDAKIIEVTGLDQIKRFSGRFTYTPAQYAQAQEINEKAAAAANTPKTYAVAKTGAPPAIDGKAGDWPELLDDATPLVEIREGTQDRFGRVALRWDADNLYVAWRVMGRSSPWKNAGQDSKFLFKTGDAVDLMLGSDPLAADGSGNLRLLFAPLGGQAAAVLYRKTVPGTPEGARVPFSSPWRTITFDSVTQPSEVKAASGPISGGYFVEAAIPWAVLGLGAKPAPGLKLRADFGVLGADSGGTATVSRKYWSNKHTGLVNDVPGEADLTPGLWGGIVLQ